MKNLSDPGRSSLQALIEDLKWVRKFVEYARYELQPGEQQFGDQFPRQDAADKAMKLLDEALAALAVSDTPCDCGVLGSREFYELMQTYRHSNPDHTRPQETVDAYEAVKTFLRTTRLNLSVSDTAQWQPISSAPEKERSVCPDCGGGWTFDLGQRRVYCRTCEGK